MAALMAEIRELAEKKSQIVGLIRKISGTISQLEQMRNNKVCISASTQKQPAEKLKIKK